MSAAMQELLAILDLERLEHNLYRGRSPDSDWQRVFGGQTIAQALVAAQRTVGEDRHVHSLHGYFMRPGDTRVPIVYEVDRIRDGRSFTTRRVVAIQHGHAIFSLEASFQVDETGLEHQTPMPAGYPAAATLPNQKELLARFGDRVPPGIRTYWMRDRPIEMRPVMLEHYTSREKLEPR
jgi:acyl-CoA thioesterase-2